MTPSNWWAGYFDDAFLRIYESFLDEERTAMEVEGVIDVMGLGPGARVLDVGCGWGRHSIELARQGYRVTGIDLSTYLLGEAERRAVRAGVDLRFIQADMREIGMEAEFDAAVSLFSSLGYFGSDDEDRRVLEGMRRALVPGGSMLIETMHRDLIAREYAERDWWTTSGGDLVWVEREFDPVAGVSDELLRWRSPDGETGEKRHSIRIRSASEWKVLLDAAGWHSAEWFGGWDLEPFTTAAERLIILAHPA